MQNVGWMNRILLQVLPLVLSALPAMGSDLASRPETVAIHSGTLTLHGWLWRPRGSGPFPAILFSHGSYGNDPGDLLDPREPELLGPVFARHGYVFLFLCRRGVGLSENQGPAEGTLMSQALAADGEPGRNRVQLQLLDTESMKEIQAGLRFLRVLSGVDHHRIGVVGHSFGSSLALLAASLDRELRAVVLFSGAARSWDPSPDLRRRLLAAAGRSTVPVFFIHAANDYSTAPGEALAAEMQRSGRPHRLKIYPASGSTLKDGHAFVFRGVATWEPDVFSFLDQYMTR
jgi:dienelactone hydrolase